MTTLRWKTTSVLLIGILVKLTSGEKEGYFLSYEKKFDVSIADIFNNVEEDESEGRQLNFDQRYGHNFSIAITFPIVTWSVPSDRKPSSEGPGTVDNPFGALGFVVLFMGCGFLLAAYTYREGPNYDAQNEALYRYYGNNNLGDSVLLNFIYDSIGNVNEALAFESCTKLAICEANARPKKYRLMTSTLIFLLNDEMKDYLPRDYEKAAAYGREKKDECYYEYPCLVHPLDFVLYIKDYIKNYLHYFY